MGKLKARFKEIAHYRHVLIIGLVLHFLLHLVFVFNTTMLEGIRETGAMLRFLDELQAGSRPLPLQGFYWQMTSVYIAFFFINIFGSLNAYFIFQAILSTLTAFFVYKTVFTVTQNKTKALLALVLLTLYVEFLLLSAVLYNQVYEILAGAIFVYFTLLLVKEKRWQKAFLYAFVIIVTLYLSLMFRNLFKYAFGLFLIYAVVYWVQNNRVLFYRFISIAAILVLLTFVWKPIDIFREGGAKPPRVLEFWGHTLYGGYGGKASFIFEENRILFYERLEQYAIDNQIDEITRDVIEDFKTYEVKRFITQEPHQWVLLQFRKAFYTFGAIPHRDGLRMLISGHIPLSWPMAAALIQIPMVVLLFLFILTMNLNFWQLYKQKDIRLIFYVLFAYLVVGISIYATYSEVYRFVVFVITIIPVVAINIGHLKTLLLPEKRKELYARLGIIALFMMVWTWQAYQALVLDRDRFFGAIEGI